MRYTEVWKQKGGTSLSSLSDKEPRTDGCGGFLEGGRKKNVAEARIKRGEFASGVYLGLGGRGAIRRMEALELPGSIINTGHTFLQKN